MTVLTRVAAALAGVLLALGATASAAGAHAVVVATNPGDGQVLPEAPSQATVQFSERVSIELGGVTVLDSEGERVDDQTSTLNPSADLVSTGLPDGLEDGTYVMTWRVVSADGHPISGSVVFGIGEATVIDTGRVAGLTETGNTSLEAAAAFTRFVLYVAALLAAGLAGYVAFVHDQDDDRWKLTPIVRAACLIAGLATVLVIALQAAMTTGRGLDAMTDLSTLRAALGEGLGWQSVAVLIGLAMVHLSTDITKLLTAQILAFYGGLTVAVSFVFWGHAREAPNMVLAVSADVVHTATAAIWLGGLVGLALTLRHRFRRRDELDPTATAAVVARFSTIAGATIIVLIAAGLVLAWQEVGSLSALRTTTYGRILLVKTLVVGAVLVVAAYNRYRLVPRVDDPAGWKRLANTLRLEVLGVVLVLALTAVLVYVTPARTASGQVPIVFNQTEPANDLQVNLVVTPAQVGPNGLHIQYLDDVGRPVDQPQTLEVQVSLPDKDIAPITTSVPRVAPGHFIVEDVQLPIAGTWTVELVARLSDFELARTPFQVRITE